MQKIIAMRLQLIISSYTQQQCRAYNAKCELINLFAFYYGILLS